jgi:hypothetical protein
MTEIVPALYSQNLRAKVNTYFFDVRESKNGHKYLSISQYWTNKTGEKKRNTLTVFSADLEDFTQAVDQLQEKVR